MFRSDEPPNGLESLVDELEEDNTPIQDILRSTQKKHAGWLSLLLRRKCETDRVQARGEIVQNLNVSIQYWNAQLCLSHKYGAIGNLSASTGSQFQNIVRERCCFYAKTFATNCSIDGLGCDVTANYRGRCKRIDYCRTTLLGKYDCASGSTLL